jgi:hypothetical protein
MLLALGAASAALDALTSLVSPKPSSSQATAGFGQTSPTPFDITSASGSANPAPMPGFAGASQRGLSPATMSALLAAQGQSSNATLSTPRDQSDAVKDLLSQLDAQSDGSANFGDTSSAQKGSRHHRQTKASSGRAGGVPSSAISAYSAVDQARRRDAQALSASLASTLSVSA